MKKDFIDPDNEFDGKYLHGNKDIDTAIITILLTLVVGIGIAIWLTGPK